jgi:aspartate/methionine/tyrosine aminotransferase
MTFPAVEYIRWAKEHPPARVNLARSGAALCPPQLLGIRAGDLVVNLPVRDGYAPLRDAIARRYRVGRDQVMAAALEPGGAHLLVDEVYLECLFGRTTESAVHAGPNVIAANSLTKAYGLDGLRAGWLLGPPALIERAWRMQDLLANNNVAPGEQLALAALRHLPAIRAHAHRTLDPNLRRVRAFFARERRLRAFVPPGGNVVFPRLPAGMSGDPFSAHLLARYSTLVVAGRFFESPRHFRISFGCPPAVLEGGLLNISRALDDLV